MLTSNHFAIANTASESNKNKRTTEHQIEGKEGPRKEMNR